AMVQGARMQNGTGEDTDPGAGALLPRARLRPPQVRALRRDRLLGALAGADDHRPVLITGPAGGGKTPLLAQVVDAVETPVAWYHLDPADGRASTLLGHLGRALAPVVPGLGAGGDGNQNWDSVEEASATLDALMPEPERIMLALDDLHL